MYHYTFGSIFIYCYYNDVNFAELMGEVGEERESYLENAQFVSNDKSRKLICSIEAELNLVCKKLDVSPKDVIFPDNYIEWLLEFLEDLQSWIECDHVEFTKDQLRWDINAWIMEKEIGEFLIDIVRYLNVDTLRYEYNISITVWGSKITFIGDLIGNGFTIYDSIISGHIKRITKFLDNLIENMEVKDSDTDEIIAESSAILDFKNVIVKTSFRKCEKDNHDTCIRNAIIYILNNTTHQIVPETLPLLYCKDCNVYYMYEDQYITLTKKGRILCRVYNTKQWQESGHTTDLFGSLNMESIFKICGYRVDANSNIPDQARHSLLDFIIQRNIVNLNQTLNFLHWLISIKKDMPHMRNAVEKWKNDLNYINNKYQEDVKAVTVKSIRR